jgi:hypothetical protein
MAAGGGPEDNAKIVSASGPDALGFISNIQNESSCPACLLGHSALAFGIAAKVAFSITPCRSPLRTVRHDRCQSIAIVWHFCHFCITFSSMKMLTVRLPDALVAEIEAEARRRMISKSDVVRERLTRPIGKRSTAALDQIADLVGSIEGLPSDLSESRRAEHGRKRDR